ncbi:MAG: site-2 protease family protein [Thermodesulfovibrionales bacterium]|nr:site-2 protease family protein [Thermodesulfovibrionales bacterium]
MKKFPFLHIFLFLLTFVATLVAGALQLGINIVKEPYRIVEGLPFSASLMSILLVHEFSHYLASKKHRVEATLPYFIPAPSLVGTFGAFIKMKSPIATRKALIDIGASGPIAGFFISVLASIIGLYLSKVVEVKELEMALSLGNSILFSFLSWATLGVTPDEYDILLHPIAFAGWIGLFITSLNLLPIGQLDGGHIIYAVFGHRHRSISIFMVFLLMFLGLFFWEGWAIWAVLMLIIGIKHPPVIFWEIPLDSRRRFISLLCFFIFLITFVPSPFKLLL